MKVNTNSSHYKLTKEWIWGHNSASDDLCTYVRDFAKAVAFSSAIYAAALILASMIIFSLVAHASSFLMGIPHFLVITDLMAGLILAIFMVYCCDFARKKYSETIKRKKSHVKKNPIYFLNM